MNKTPRKRQSSEASTPYNGKTIKIDENVKENIPPDFSGVINSYESNVNLHEFRTKITTPKKTRGNLKELPVTPSANVKLLANVAAYCDYVECVVSNPVKIVEICDQMSCDSDSLEMSTIKANRKEKSLAIICARFLAMYPEYPPSNKKIIVSLDEVCIKLGVERRRLYDIVNVLESIDIVAKNAKNQYLWFGKNNLLSALHKLQIAAIAEKTLEKLQYVINTDDGSCKQSCILSEVQNFNKMFERPNSPMLSPSSTSTADIRKEKSLGVMSQKFLMLFLVSPNKVISLGVAAKVLNGFLQRNERQAQIKTQVRRLYDVANVLSCIGLIQKENTVSHCVRKPAFKYIGPDLKDFKDNIVCVPKFQHIVEAAELEHQKLNLKESYISPPSTGSGLSNVEHHIKPRLQNIQLNQDVSSALVKSTCHTENKSTVTVPFLMQPSLKLVNDQVSESNPTVPCYILNNVSTDKSSIQNLNRSHAFLIFNPIVPSKQVKVDPSPIQGNNKALNQQTFTLSSEQRDAILKSLNISLSSQQIASIHLDGASKSNSQDVPCNVLKIFNKCQPTKVTEEKSTIKDCTPKDFESTSISNTRSNTPSSSGTVDSPFSIPSGYVTPIPSVSSDISFVSNTEVQDILKNIENHSKLETLNSKLNISKQENEETNAEIKINSTEAISLPSYLINMEKKSIINTNLNSYYKNKMSSSINQLISNDSCSSDSINLEVSNILKSKSINDNLVKSKPFLIDEKTLLSPIKIPKTPSQILVPSTLISPPHIIPNSVFVFNTPSTSYQTTKINNIPNIVKVIPNILSKQRNGVFIKLDNKEK